MLSKKIIFSIFLLSVFYFAKESLNKKTPPTEPSIVFVHLGPELPSYLSSALSQARLFNPDMAIYLLANEEALKNLSQEVRSSNVQCISCESVPLSKAHKQFKARSKLDKKFRKGFWIFTTERFFYLSAFIRQYGLSDVFHLENDVMLYRNLKEVLPIFKEHYSNMIGATFDNDQRCIPGFLYIANAVPLEQFTQFVAKKEDKSGNDMKFLSEFREKHHKKWIDSLPILTPEYAQDHELISTSGLKGTDPSILFQHFENFHSIFDAAALGQYLGGIDPRNGESAPGFINESCLFNPSYSQFVWEEDLEGRRVPWMVYKDQKYRINNLHIHSKNLKEFESKK